MRTTALGATWVSHSGSGALVRVPKARCAVRATGRGSPRTGGPLGGPAVHPIARYGVRVSRVFVSGTCLPWYRPRCQLSWRTTASCPKDNCSRRNSPVTWWAAWSALRSLLITVVVSQVTTAVSVRFVMPLRARRSHGIGQEREGGLSFSRCRRTGFFSFVLLASPFCCRW